MKIRCIFSLAVFLLPLLTGAQNPKEILNVPYSDDLRDTLKQINLVLPADRGAPLLLWIGGGAWAYVDRHVEMDICRQLAKEGIATAAVGHRLSAKLLREPHDSMGVTHPAHIEDVAEAFAFLLTEAEKYGYDASRIFVGGFSSGAHLSSLLAMDRRYLAQHGLATSQIQGVISVGGAFDIIHYRDYLTDLNPSTLESHFNPVFGTTEKQLRDASPSNYLQDIAVPMLIISDTNTYPYNNVFEEQLKESDFNDFDVLHVGSMSHAELWRDLGSDDSTYRNILVDFILRGKDS